MLSETLKSVEDVASTIRDRLETDGVASQMKPHVVALSPILHDLGAWCPVTAQHAADMRGWIGRIREEVRGMNQIQVLDLYRQRTAAANDRLKQDRDFLTSCIARIDAWRLPAFAILRDIGAQAEQLRRDITTTDAKLQELRADLKARKDRGIVVAVFSFLSPLVMIVNESVNLAQHGELTVQTLGKIGQEMDAAQRRLGTCEAMEAASGRVVDALLTLTQKVDGLHNALDFTARAEEIVTEFVGTRGSTTSELGLKVVESQLSRVQALAG